MDLIGCDGQKELSSAEMYDSISMNWKNLPNCPVVRSNAGKRFKFLSNWNKK